MRNRKELTSIFLVVKTNVFLQDMNDFAAMNEVYSECKSSSITSFYKHRSISVFTERHPARSTVQVAGLPKVLELNFSHIFPSHLL